MPKRRRKELFVGISAIRCGDPYGDDGFGLKPPPQAFSAAGHQQRWRHRSTPHRWLWSNDDGTIPLQASRSALDSYLMKGTCKSAGRALCKGTAQFYEAMTQPRRISSTPGWPKVTWLRIARDLSFIRADQSVSTYRIHAQVVIAIHSVLAGQTT